MVVQAVFAPASAGVQLALPISVTRHRHVSFRIRPIRGVGMTYCARTSMILFCGSLRLTRTQEDEPSEVGVRGIGARDEDEDERWMRASLWDVLARRVCAGCRRCQSSSWISRRWTTIRRHVSECEE
ncbi:hypothetical protein PENSPDRAFT_416847 [Peniophora sp. CONT]|nr:hypothetical protein PENSPDRAFT_416847 [Peniophora sp. CONT]